MTTREQLEHRLDNQVRTLNLLMVSRLQFGAVDTWYDRQIKNVKAKIKLLENELVKLKVTEMQQDSES